MYYIFNIANIAPVKALFMYLGVHVDLYNWVLYIAHSYNQYLIIKKLFLFIKGFLISDRYSFTIIG